MRTGPARPTIIADPRRRRTENALITRRYEATDQTGPYQHGRYFRHVHRRGRRRRQIDAKDQPPAFTRFLIRPRPTPWGDIADDASRSLLAGCGGRTAVRAAIGG